jgi:hypothetical protein
VLDKFKDTIYIVAPDRIEYNEAKNVLEKDDIAIIHAKYPYKDYARDNYKAYFYTNPTAIVITDGWVTDTYTRLLVKLAYTFSLPIYHIKYTYDPRTQRSYYLDPQGYGDIMPVVGDSYDVAYHETDIAEDYYKAAIA